MKLLLEETRRDIFMKVASETLPFGEPDEDGGILKFLKRVWDLDSMPSDDSRFKDAMGDEFRYTVNSPNNRTYEYLFLERLSLASAGDEIFFRFIEAVVSPEVRKTSNEIIRYVNLITPFFYGTYWGLERTDYHGGLPVYSVRPLEKKGDLPPGVKENSIPFFVLDTLSKHQAFSPKKSPCFVLLKDNWNDYGFQTLFNFYYYPNTSTESVHLGAVKIMKEGEQCTSDAIPENFVLLDNSYCSLGQNIEFYKKIEEHFATDFLSILYALKDCAFFPEILERFENNGIFQTSLVRFDTQEQLSRKAMPILRGYDLANLYKFDYLFSPKYSTDSIKMSFQFDSSPEFSHRIYALIGKNGTGKTQLLASFPFDLSRKDRSSFPVVIPPFSKVIMVSYSIFDKFELPKKTAEFNYVYCGLKESPNKILPEEALLERFLTSIDKIKDAKRTVKLHRILGNFLEKEMVDTFFGENTENNPQEAIFFKKREFIEHKDELSSGQNITLYIITEIIANIRFDSIILYDEPETHLHPNAVSQLINTIYDLVEQFESYCIIATHSPLVIQEIPSRDVYVIERESNVASVRKIVTESFGENLTTLTEEVFGAREVSKQYKKIIKGLVDNNWTFEDIVSTLKSDNIPLNLNVTLYIKSLILNKNEEPETF